MGRPFPAGQPPFFVRFLGDQPVYEAEARVLFAPESDALRFLPEGPYPYGEQLSWVAIQHGANETSGSLNLLDLDVGKNRSLPLKGRPGFAFPSEQEGVYVVGLERRLEAFYLETGTYEPLSEEVEVGVEGTIINDGVACETGILFGCKDLKFQEAKAGLYFWRAADRQLTRLRSDQICSNGKVLQRDGQRWSLLDIDSPTKTVVRYAFDPQAVTLGEPEVVLDLTNLSMFPDGMIETPDGASVIIAFYNPQEADAGEARQYGLASGQLEAIWRTPGSPQVTCPQLIERAGKVQLVLTTAVEHMPAERRSGAPHAGYLFIADTPFESLPATPRAPRS